MCPHCGCPGDAIAEAVALLEQEEVLAPTLYPVLRVQTDETAGHAVAYTEAGEHYVLLDAGLLDGATSLSLTLLTTNTPVR